MEESKEPEQFISLADEIKVDINTKKPRKMRSKKLGNQKSYGDALPKNESIVAKKSGPRSLKNQKTTITDAGIVATIGTKKQVYNGLAFKTVGGLDKSKLMKNKRGKVVSIAKHELGNRLFSEHGNLLAKKNE